MLADLESLVKFSLNWVPALASSYPHEGSVAALVNDRCWFQRHPKALIRFRPIRPAEFSPLERLGEAPPSFVPEALRGKSSLSWVAVVDLTRSLRAEEEDPALSLRVRLLTVPLRSKALQRVWAPIYIKAVLSDLLHQEELWNDVDDDWQAA